MNLQSYNEFLNEALKAKKPNDQIEIDIDFAGDDNDLKKLSKKHNLEADEYEPGMVMLKGKKKDVLAYLQSNEYDMDPADISDLFPELLEADDKKLSLAQATIQKKRDLEDKKSELIKKLKAAGEEDNAKASKLLRLQIKKIELQVSMLLIDEQIKEMSKK